MTDTKTVFVPQFQWAPPDEPIWIDASAGEPSMATAEAQMQLAVWGFYHRLAQGKGDVIRTGIAATRIVKRTITDEVIAATVRKESP